MAEESIRSGRDVAERPRHTVPVDRVVALGLPLPTERQLLLVGPVVVSQGVHIVSMFIPGWRDVLGVEPVAFATWAILLGSRSASS